ncbi:MAG: hypothetical protein KME60_32410 [Cyanomargarita calcarea GSE-NOS-MK-12-04C]|jgi:hypothetical protein|uniref:Uncharacterized protein n=1 Tax=Cyanomargarita calcarea GSE-NOS-MK-12-04C TaxID=2839659 RepID=A0A951QU58_9CYAN|nr:hypothetical protein [Cyanomargarita calcarea GSE-NOS-MK-12-04C]
MITITSDEIANFRSQLTDNPEALAALDLIEDCQGNLEDATSLILMRDGKEQFRQVDLAELANKCRKAICSEPTEDFLGLLNLVGGFLPPPASLAVPVVVYVLKVGVKNFCKVPKPQQEWGPENEEWGMGNQEWG